MDRIERAMNDDGSGDDVVAGKVLQELERAATEEPPARPSFASVATERPAFWIGVDAGSADRCGPTGPAAGAPIQTEVSEERLAGLSVCFTGASVCSIRGMRLSREDQERLVAGAGLEVRQSVSARLDILVLANP